MRRREFIGALGSVAAWPVVARAQPSEKTRRFIYLHGLAENDPEAQARIAAFRQALAALGWIEGRNITIDHHFAGGDPAREARAHAEHKVLAAISSRAERTARDTATKSNEPPAVPTDRPARFGSAMGSSNCPARACFQPPTGKRRWRSRGIVAKRRDRPYRSGRSPDWIKVKNPSAPPATRIWNRQSRTRTVSVQIPLRNKIATIYDL
jgi:hypothetical protein